MLRLGAHQLLGDAGARARRRRHLGRPRPGRGRPAAPPGSSTRCCAGSPSTTSTTWVRAVAPDPAADPLGFAAVGALPPALGGRRARGRAGGPRGRARRSCCAPTTTRRGSRWSPGPGSASGTSCSAAGRRDADAVVAAAASGSPGATRRRSPRSPTAGPACRTRARSWSRWRSRGAESTGATSGGSTSAPGPGGKAALLGALVAAARRPPARGRAAAAPRGPGPPGGGRAARRDRRRASTADGTRAGVGAGRVRPGARRRARAPGSVRCGGGPRRGGAAPPTTSTSCVPLQRALLGAALRRRRVPAGVVAYVTCSPVLAETAGVVGGRAGRAARDVDAPGRAALLPEVPDAAGRSPGTVQLWPHRHGTDAMFLALLRRTLEVTRPRQRLRWPSGPRASLAGGSVAARGS